MGNHNVKERFEILQEILNELVINNALSLNYTDYKGVFANVNTDLKSNERTLKLDSDYVMTPYDYFPFKEEITDILSQISQNPTFPEYQATPEELNDFFLGTVSNALHLLININTNKTDLDINFPEYKSVSLYTDRSSK